MKTTYSIKKPGEVYVYINGKLAYKRWHDEEKPAANKKSSILINEQWPNVWLPRIVEG